MASVGVCVALGLALLGAAGASPPLPPSPPVARAEPVLAPDPDAAREFLAGNTIFVLAHEFGHVIIGDFAVPILGLEENSADTIAAGVLILAERSDVGTLEDTPFSRLLGMAAIGNILTWRGGLELDNPELLYWAHHDLSVRRAARILCLLVGSDQRRFSWLVDTGLIPEVRAEQCPDEYAIAATAVQWVGRTWGRFRDGRAEDDGREITIRYFDPETPAQARLLRRLQEAQVMEKVVAFYDRAFRFPAPLNVRLVNCGSPNAYWDRDSRQLRFCYELLETFEKQSVDPGVSRAYAALLEHEKTNPNKAESKPPGVTP